jgi:hypothetical protein
VNLNEVVSTSNSKHELLVVIAIFVLSVKRLVTLRNLAHVGLTSWHDEKQPTTTMALSFRHDDAAQLDKGVYRFQGCMTPCSMTALGIVLDTMDHYYKYQTVLQWQTTRSLLASQQSKTFSDDSNQHSCTSHPWRLLICQWDMWPRWYAWNAAANKQGSST